jgi:hypothetical protein
VITYAYLSPTDGKLEIMNQISDQFDIFSKDPLMKESLRKNFKRLSRKDQLELLKIFHDAKVILKESGEEHFSAISN